MRSSKNTGLLNDTELAKAASMKAAAENRELAAESREMAASLRADISRLSSSLEAQTRAVAGLTEGLTRSERDGLARHKDIRDRQAELRSELDQVGHQSETVRKELEARLENLRRHLVEMIGSGEIHVAEVEDQIKVAQEAVANLKVVENNHNLNLENKLEAVRAAVDTMVATNKKIKSQDTEQILINLRKDLGGGKFLIIFLSLPTNLKHLLSV
jgi:hypothetical protein